MCTGNNAILFLLRLITDPAKLALEADPNTDGVPQISLAEMLEDLHISKDATGGAGADMIE